MNILLVLSIMSTNANLQILPEVPIEITNVHNLPWQPEGIRYDSSSARDLNPNVVDLIAPASQLTPITDRLCGRFLKFEWACDLTNYSCIVDDNMRIGTPGYKIVGFLDTDPANQVRTTSYITKMSKGLQLVTQNLIFLYSFSLFFSLLSSFSTFLLILFLLNPFIFATYTFIN